MPNETTSSARPELVGAAEAEQILGDVRRSTLMRWVADGLLPVAYRAPGPNGFVVFLRSDVVTFAKRRAEEAAERARRLADRASAQVPA